jgi:polar amino acid transport system substrate-binding protein
MTTHRDLAAAAGAGSLGARLRGLRERALLTQEELAEGSGLSVRTIRGLERGDIRRPRSASVRQLADALQLAGQEREELVAAARGSAGDPAPGGDPVPGTGLVEPAVGSATMAAPPAARSRRRLPVWVGAAVALAVLVVLASQLGGGTPGQGTAGPPVTAMPDPPATGPALKPLPTRVRAAGRIVVSSQGSLAPIVFVEPGSRRFKGLDVDLAEAMGRHLRVRFQFRKVPFTHSFREVREGRSDIAMSVFRDINRAPDLDYVHYLDPGTAFVVPRGNPLAVRSRDDLCGRTVARSLVTPQEALLRQSRRCLAKGKDKVTVVTAAAEQPLRRVLELVRSGGADVAMLDLPLAGHALGTSGTGRHLEVVALDVDAGPYGIVFRKADGQLRDAVRSALQAIIADGTYGRILARWDLTRRAVRTAAVNGRDAAGSAGG